MRGEGGEDRLIYVTTIRALNQVSDTLTATWIYCRRLRLCNGLVSLAKRPVFSHIYNDNRCITCLYNPEGQTATGKPRSRW
jgi:hypothetical protein